MNQQKKTSKRTSLFEPTYSSVTSVSKDNLRIVAAPSTPSQSTASDQSASEPRQASQHDTDFELKKYYENLNSQFNLNLSQQNSQNSQNQHNQTIGNPSAGGQQSTIHTDSSIGHQYQHPPNNELIDESANNYSSYFSGINRLTNYFVSRQPTVATTASSSDPHPENYDNHPLSYSGIESSELSSADITLVNQVNQVHQASVQTPASAAAPDTMLMNSDPNDYHLPKPHWFYKVPASTSSKETNSADKTIYEEQADQETVGIVPEDVLQDSTLDENWLPFAFHDSEALEKAYLSLDTNSSAVVSTNGDRYDCYIRERLCRSVYWAEDDQPIRRCTWYYKKEGHTRFLPYTEQFAFKLEQIYHDVLMNNKWNQRIELNGTGQVMIIFYSYNSIIHYELRDDNLIKDEWNSVSENPVKPKVVVRELTIDELENYEVCLKEDEQYRVDNLIFCVHGIGSICDIRLRSIKEVVDDLRKISLDLTRTHFRLPKANASASQQTIGRCEFIPMFWHDFLHGSETGIDERLKTITLKSVPKLRTFTNDCLLDALFYTSQMYCQHIVNVVTEEINRLYDLFISRNPYFKGSVSISGHSLGSVIMFDLLANQCDRPSEEQAASKIVALSPWNADNKQKLPDRIVYNSKTKYHGQEQIQYPRLKFKTDCFFALGSPISMFLTLRGFSEIDPEFQLPNCKHVFNIFHPLDPIAYKIEPMINSEFGKRPPVTIPHHKGRKRMHIEIKENLVKMGSDIKEKVLFGIKSTWNSVSSFVMPRSSSNLSEINEQLNQDQPNNEPMKENLMARTGAAEEGEMYEYSNEPSSRNSGHHIRTGSLNGSRRIDFQLQEKPIEFFNQYIFALATHACYWSSEDCVLFMLKELYELKSIYSIKDLEDTSLNSESNNCSDRVQQQQPARNANPTNFDAQSRLTEHEANPPPIAYDGHQSSQQPQAAASHISTSIDIDF